jgi:hypothetical protein
MRLNNLVFVLSAEKSVTTEYSVQIQVRFSSHSVSSQSVSNRRNKGNSFHYSDLTIYKNEFSSVSVQFQFRFSSVSVQLCSRFCIELVPFLKTFLYQNCSITCSVQLIFML